MHNNTILAYVTIFLLLSRFERIRKKKHCQTITTMIWAKEEKTEQLSKGYVSSLQSFNVCISSLLFFFFEPHSVGPMYFELIVKNEEYLASYDDVFVLLQIYSNG